MASSFSSLLDSATSLLFMEFVDRLLTVEEERAFIDLMSETFRGLLPHERLICGFGHINPHGVSGYRYLSIDFPAAYLEAIARPDGGLVSPLMEQWIETREPIWFACDDSHPSLPEAWKALARDHRLGNMAAHGMRDLNSNTSSYFNFCGVPAEYAASCGYLLKLAVPHLHAALARVMAPAKRPQPDLPSLTPREREILSWLYLGKTNWEIGSILGVSEKTVKNHLSNIFQKLGVTNRTQAQARITELNLFRK